MILFGPDVHLTMIHDRAFERAAVELVTDLEALGESSVRSLVVWEFPNEVGTVSFPYVGSNGNACSAYLFFVQDEGDMILYDCYLVSGAAQACELGDTIREISKRIKEEFFFEENS